MSHTSSQLVDWVRQLIREPVASEYQDAHVRAMLNVVLDEVWDAVEPAAVDKGWLVERATPINMTARVDEYAIPSGYVNVTQIAMYDGHNWGRLHKLDQGRHSEGLTPVDTPTHFTLLKATFLVSPPPSVSRAGAIRVYGTKEPTHFTGASSETSGLPWKCDRVMVLGAAALILEAEGAPTAGAFRRQYDRALAELPSKLDRRHGEALDAEDDFET